MIANHNNGTSGCCQKNNSTTQNTPNRRIEPAVVELTTSSLSAAHMAEPTKTTKDHFAYASSTAATTNIRGNNDNNNRDDNNDNEEEYNNEDDSQDDNIHHSLPERISSVPPTPPQPPPRRLSAAKNLLYRFFYPKKRRRRPMARTEECYNDPISHIHRTTMNNNNTTTNNNNNNSSEDDNDDEEEIFHSYMAEQQQQQQQDQKFVHEFWTTFDDILMLSIFTQIGIVARLGASTWFGRFNDVFSSQSALFVNLPLNCLSCFCLGILCSGDQLWDIVVRTNPPNDPTPPTTTSSPNQRYYDFHPTNNHNNNNKIHRSFNNDSATTTNRNKTGRSLLTKPPDNTKGTTENKTKKDVVVQRIKASTTTTTSSSSLDDRRKDGLEVVVENDDDDEATTSLPPGPTNHPSRNNAGGWMRHRRRNKQQQQEQSAVAYHTTTTTTMEEDDTTLGRRLQQEMRQVQLLALERRIRASKSLLLFPVVKRKHVDVMEHYHSSSDRDPNRNEYHSGVMEDFYYHNDLALSSNIKEDDDDNDEWWDQHNRKNGNRLGSLRHETSDEENLGNLDQHHPDQPDRKDKNSPNSPLSTCTEESQEEEEEETTTIASSSPEAKPNVDDQQQQQHQAETNIITDFTTNVQDNVVQFRRVNRNNLLLRGWVKGTTLEEMSDDLLLGLRDGFCGAISSFSSWNASMVNLLKQGDVTKALVGYMLGIQLPIIAYRFGQQVALYIFVWRTRREARRAERRGGYAIRLSIDEESDHNPKSKPKEIPSVRAVFFALFVLALIIQCTLIFFLRNPDDQQLALSLLFSPLGVFARWRLRRLNSWRPGFPLGTFISNMLACALAGSFGTLLAGNPGPRERIVLVSIIAGFGGTSSNLARFIVEILAGTDPILLRFDGVIYAAISIGAAMVIALASSSSVEWVDETVAAKAAAGDKEGFLLNPNNNDTIPGDLLLF